MPGDFRHLGKPCDVGLPDLINGFEIPHQRLPPGRTHAGNAVQHGTYLLLAPQGTVIFNGETVRLILDSGDEFEALAAGIDRDLPVLIVQPPRPVVIVLDHAADRDGKAQLGKHLKRHVYLALSAVHQKQIRETGEAAELLLHLLFFQLLRFLHAMLEASRQHLLHAGVVIRARHRFDLEFPVVAALRLSLFIDHHGTHVFKSADVGNVECLHPVRLRDGQKFADLLHRADGAALLPLDPFPVLAENQLRIGRRKLHQLFLGSLLRHMDVYFTSLSGGKPLLQHRNVLDFMLQHQFLWNKRRARIELLDKIQKDLRLGTIFCPGHDEMLPADQLAAPDEKDLHHRVVFIPRQGDDVLVLSVAVRDLLLLCHLLHAVVQIPIADRILKFQIFRRFLHFLLQAVQDRSKISV